MIPLLLSRAIAKQKCINRLTIYCFISCISRDIFDNTTNLIKDKCHRFLQLNKKKNRLTLSCHEVTIPSFENHWDLMEVKTFCSIAAQTTSQWVQEKLCTVPKFRTGLQEISLSLKTECQHLCSSTVTTWGSSDPHSMALPAPLVCPSF